MDPMDNFVTVKTSDSTTEIRENLSVFGSEVLSTKFPNAIDGLKDVQRRIVWNSRNYTELKGMNAFVGEVSNYHTGGDSSIVGATIRLAQRFMVGHPLIYVDGKSGEYYDPSAAAAPRYLEVCISDFSNDVYFRNVDLDTIPMQIADTHKGIEPSYLIPVLPMGLILGNLTVGFGFKSYIPMIDITNVCDLVMLFADYFRKGGIGIPDKGEIAKLIIPSFPIKNLIRNKEQLLAAYRQGDYEYPIAIEGWCELSGNTITLRAVPYGSDFGTVTEGFRKLLKDKKCKYYDYIDSANNYSADVAEFSISVKRGKNPFEVLDYLRGILRFNNNWKPLYNYTRNGKVSTLPPHLLTLCWYQERRLSIASGLKYRLAELISRQMLLKAMLIVVEHVDEVIAIIRSSENEAEAVRRLHQRWTELTLKQAQRLAQQRLSTLTKSSRADIENELDQIEIKIATTSDAFNKIDDIIYHDAEFIKKRYATTSFTRYSTEFIGYVQFGEWGIINFFDYEDMYDILNTKGWPASVKKTVHFYDNRHSRKFIVKNGRLSEVTEMSKEVCCENMICYPANSNELTLAIGKDGNTCIIERDVLDVSADYLLCPISKTFYAIHRNGTVTEEQYTSFSIRKSVSKGSRTDLIYGVPNKVKDIVVFHMNTKDLNCIRADRILSGNDLGKLRTVPSGEMIILGIYNLKTKGLILNIPEKCRKNSSMEHLIIRNLSQFFEKKDNLTLPIGKSSKEFKFVRNNKVRTLYSLEVE